MKMKDGNRMLIELISLYHIKKAATSHRIMGPTLISLFDFMPEIFSISNITTICFAVDKEKIIFRYTTFSPVKAFSPLFFAKVAMRENCIIFHRFIF